LREIKKRAQMSIEIREERDDDYPYKEKHVREGQFK